MPWPRRAASPPDSFRSLPLTRWPMVASTDAMALMPAPPLPTTWIDRDSDRSMASPADPVAGTSATRPFLDQPGHPLRGIGHGGGPHGLGHLEPEVGLLDQRGQLGLEAVGGALRIGDHDGAAARRQSRGV